MASRGGREPILIGDNTAVLGKTHWVGDGDKEQKSICEEKEVEGTEVVRNEIHCRASTPSITEMAQTW